MIYSRSGDAVTILRVATLADVQAIERRKPDKTDREAIRNGSYVVIDHGGTERIYHQAFLRADGGSREVFDAIDKLPAPGAGGGRS